jgi:hypothetical protein
MSEIKFTPDAARAINKFVREMSEALLELPPDKAENFIRAFELASLAAEQSGLEAAGEVLLRELFRRGVVGADLKPILRVLQDDKR